MGQGEMAPLARAAGKKKSRNIGSLGEKSVGWRAAQEAARGVLDDLDVLRMLERC
jgi:hypothetical protein